MFTVFPPSPPTPLGQSQPAGTQKAKKNGNNDTKKNTNSSSFSESLANRNRGSSSFFFFYFFIWFHLHLLDVDSILFSITCARARACVCVCGCRCVFYTELPSRPLPRPFSTGLRYLLFFSSTLTFPFGCAMCVCVCFFLLWTFLLLNIVALLPFPRRDPRRDGRIVVLALLFVCLFVGGFPPTNLLLVVFMSALTPPLSPISTPSTLFFFTRNLSIKNYKAKSPSPPRFVWITTETQKKHTRTPKKKDFNLIPAIVDQS